MGKEILKNVKGNLLVIFLIIYFIYLGFYLYKNVSLHPTLVSMYVMIVILLHIHLKLKLIKIFKMIKKIFKIIINHFKKISYFTYS